MSRTGDRPEMRAPGFPRVSGDEPAASAVKYGDLMFSPRERG